MADKINEKDQKNMTTKDIINWLTIAGWGVVVLAGISSFGCAIGYYRGYGLGIKNVLEWLKEFAPDAFTDFKKAYPLLVSNLGL